MLLRKTSEAQRIKFKRAQVRVATSCMTCCRMCTTRYVRLSIPPASSPATPSCRRRFLRYPRLFVISMLPRLILDRDNRKQLNSYWYRVQ